MREQLFDQPSFLPMFEDYRALRGKCIGITGHQGVLGKILYDRFLHHGVSIEPYVQDITDTVALAAWFREKHFDYFFHFAAVVPTRQVADNPLVAYETNVLGGFNICKNIIRMERDCWLFLSSSSHVYKPNPVPGEQCLRVGSLEQPDSFYGISKLVCEQVSRPVLEYADVSYCIGRIFSFSGTRQTEPYLVPTLIRKIKELPEDGVLDIVNPHSVRDISDAESVIDSILYLAKSRSKGIVNIGSGVGMRIEDIAHHIARKLHKTIRTSAVGEQAPNSLVADVSALKEIVSA